MLVAPSRCNCTFYGIVINDRQRAPCLAEAGVEPAYPDYESENLPLVYPACSMALQLLKRELVYYIDILAWPSSYDWLVDSSLNL